MTPNQQYTFRYRVRNWSDYNRALIARGRLTFWFDEDAVAAWRNADPPKGLELLAKGSCSIQSRSYVLDLYPD